MGISSKIHSTAIVHSKAIIAQNVEVGPYSIIGEFVEIGEGTVIGNHVTITGHTSIGKEEQNFFITALLASLLKTKNIVMSQTMLKIGDRNTIREFCTFNLGTIQDKKITTIGNDNWIMAYVHIAHDCIIGDNVILANNTSLAGHVEVNDFAILGGITGVHQFCKGRLSFNCCCRINCL